MPWIHDSPRSSNDDTNLNAATFSLGPSEDDDTPLGVLRLSSGTGTVSREEGTRPMTRIGILYEHADDSVEAARLYLETHTDSRGVVTADSEQDEGIWALWWDDTDRGRTGSGGTLQHCWFAHAGGLNIVLEDMEREVVAHFHQMVGPFSLSIDSMEERRLPIHQGEARTLPLRPRRAESHAQNVGEVRDVHEDGASDSSDEA